VFTDNILYYYYIVQGIYSTIVGTSYIRVYYTNIILLYTYTFCTRVCGDLQSRVSVRYDMTIC